MRDVKLLGAAKNCINKYIKNNIKSIRMGVKKAEYEVISERGNSGMQLVCTVCIFVVSALFIASGGLMLGGMITCIDYFKRMVLMLDRISQRFLTFPGRMVAINSIMDIENIESEDYQDNLPSHPIKQGDIQLCNVRFSYNKYI